MEKCPKCGGDSEVLDSSKGHARSRCLSCDHEWTWPNPDLEDPRRSVKEVEDRIAMFYRAKRETPEMTDQQRENCDSAIQILRWFLSGMTEVSHKHNWRYFYVRGKDNQFIEYPFPVWLAGRVCECQEREILKPDSMDFNSGIGIWTPDRLIFMSSGMLSKEERQRL